ncbi:predicted protein [Streptomyces sp. SPB78]|nr:predicted protein [Streptomyces sp. SPB78]
MCGSLSYGARYEPRGPAGGGFTTGGRRRSAAVRARWAPGRGHGDWTGNHKNDCSHGSVVDRSGH